MILEKIDGSNIHNNIRFLMATLNTKSNRVSYSNCLEWLSISNAFSRQDYRESKIKTLLNMQRLKVTNPYTQSLSERSATKLKIFLFFFFNL